MEELRKNQMNVFPDYETVDPDQLWINLIKLFSDALKSYDFFILTRVIQKIRLMVFNHFFPITTERMAVIIPPLFNFITTYPFISYKLQKEASYIFCRICSYPHRLPSIHLQLEKTLSFFHNLYNIKARAYRLGPTDIQCFYPFFNSVSYFFDENDADKIISLYYDQIGYDEPNSLLALSIICRLLPPKQFHRVFKDFLKLVDADICSKITEIIFFYFTRASFFNPDFDWSPYYDLIFHAILCSMDPNIEIVGVTAGMEAKTESILSIGYDDQFLMSLNGAFLISIILPGNYQVLKRLKDLINLMKPLLTPNSKKGGSFSLFLMNLINFFHRRIRFIDYQDHLFIDELVRIIAPFLKTALFTGHESISTIMRKTVSKLCDMSIQIMKEEILPMAIEKMIDIENTSLANRCFKIMIKMIPALLQKKNIEENIGYIPTIVENSFYSMKNYTNINTSFGMSVICLISYYMYFPKEIDYMNQKEKNAVYSMASRIVDFVTFFMKGGNSISGKPVIVHEKMHIFFKIVAYFASFEDSILIENFPRIFEALDPDFQPHSVCNIMRCMTIAKGDIVIHYFLPKFMNILKNVIPSHLKFYTNAICGVIYTSPAILDYLDDLCDLTFDMMKTLEVKKLKNVSYLFLDIIQALTTYVNTDWKCSEMKEDAREMWGNLYKKYEVKPKWFWFNREIIIKYAQKFFDFTIPLIKENYTKCEPKVQERLMLCFGYLFIFFTNRGSLESIEPLPLEPELNALKSILLDTIIDLLQKDLCQSALKPIFNVLRLAKDSSTNITSSGHLICSTNLGNKLSGSAKYSRFLIMAHRQTVYNLIKQFYVTELTEAIKRLIDAVLPFISSAYRNISASASYYILCYGSIYPKVGNEIIPKALSFLEKGDYNEDQLRGYLMFARGGLIFAVYHNPTFLIRYIRMIIQLKYEKKWNITNSVSLCVTEIERICYNYLQIKTDENWETFLSEMPTMNRTIDIHHFNHIIQFCVNHMSSIPVEIFQYLLLNVLNETQANKYSMFKIISSIFTKIKPIAPKIQTKERPEFVDNGSVGFFCQPDHYTSYSGPSVFTNPDDPLLKCFLNIVDGEYIANLIPSCVTMHPDKDDPPFISIIVYIWKGLSQLLKYKIVEFIGDKLIGMLRSTPAHSITACEILGGIASGTKHWSKEETKNCQDLFLKPFLVELFQHKFTDSTTSVFEYIAINRDSKRLRWIVELLEQLLNETNGIELNQVITACCCIFTHFGFDFDQEMSRIIIDIVIPKFSDFSNMILANICELGFLVSCRDSLSVTPNKDYKCEWLYPFFTEIIDREIVQNTDKTIKLLCTILIPWKTGYYRMFDIVCPRLQILFNSYSKVTQKYEKEGKYVLLIAAEFQWHLYPDKLITFSKQLIQILPQQKWRTKEAAIGFFHLMTFLHIFQLSMDIIQFLFDEVVPFFLFDDNDQIVDGAIAFLNLLVNMIYVDDLDKFAQLILSEFKDDSNSKKKLGFLHSCSLLANLTVWEKCPSWLPNIFMELENLNMKDKYLSQRFQKAMQEFWKRHQFIQIPEIEEYRGLIRRDYFA